MNEKTFRVLEFDKIIKLLINEAQTTIGKQLTAELKPETSLEKVQRLQDETDEAMSIIRLNKTIPLGGITDIREPLKRSLIGSTLSANECLNVSTTIYGGRQTKNFIDNLEIEVPYLESYAYEITPLYELEKEINAAIDEHAHVIDTASEKLRGIRSSIRDLEARVRERLNQFTRSKSKMLSDSIITIRNDRFVLPVKSEYRGAIGGIVHDQSSSGQTVFMEPQAVVEINNRLQQAILNENEEIERILNQLTLKIAEHNQALTTNLSSLASIDNIFAKARLGKKMKASMPTLNDQGYIEMKQARHPLIPLDEVVASDIIFGKEHTAIVITGPNTGGKTVTLKMVGLCTLMAQSGLQLPAQDGCEIAVFDYVFADIGDEQSIEQNLSTFSSHMTNIVDIMSKVDDKTLVLFDELGAGTDPEEGAALAMSILDEVIKRDARVIATTHYPELKAYGFNRDRVMNASVEFDVETLKPTYRLLLGVPGRSNAFEISKRLGLSQALIDEAQSHIGVDSQTVDTMITSLEEAKFAAEKDYQQAKERLKETESLKADLEKELAEINKHKETIYKKAEERAEKALKKAREEAEFVVSEIKSMKNQSNWKEHEWIDAKKMLDEAQPDLSKKDQIREPKKAIDDGTLNVGDDIKHLSINQEGTVIEQTGKNEYLVQVGMIKLKAKRNNLQKIKSKSQEVEQVTRFKRTSPSVKPELDLRGVRFDDAILKIENYLDSAILAGFPQVSIIHGKGTGALRKGATEYLKTHPNVKSYRLGGQNEGGSGVTVVELN